MSVIEIFPSPPHLLRTTFLNSFAFTRASHDVAPNSGSANPPMATPPISLSGIIESSALGRRDWFYKR
ncbi:hypothetical protein TSUD_17730 [Trifolium subterraneum]|uniref:Uncharacterized protein n=1 Tax=Trifolium subterraneum TaxID=3900 RepID=A0A2Z6MP14_TRISU|nr:hypothetical protein TSUD_17730 [Trifolium subterraneum]